MGPFGERKRPPPSAEERVGQGSLTVLGVGGVAPGTGPVRGQGVVTVVTVTGPRALWGP